MYDKNGKLKEKRFEDGTTENYREDGSIKKRCPHAEDGLAGEQCCDEYDENGKETGMSSCSSWIV